jgi:hypothetical protein
MELEASYNTRERLRHNLLYPEIHVKTGGAGDQLQHLCNLAGAGGLLLPHYLGGAGGLLQPPSGAGGLLQHSSTWEEQVACYNPLSTHLP